MNRQSYKQPTSYQWSLGVQHSLSTKTVLSMAYVGNTNRFQSDRTEYNLPDQAALIPIINGVGGANYNTAAGLPALVSPATVPDLNMGRQLHCS